MPAKAGIQGREGMDTGLRRYDGNLVPIRRPDHPCTCIFKGHEEQEGSENCSSLHVLRVFVVNNSDGSTEITGPAAP